jgi:hypothetical protein
MRPLLLDEIHKPLGYALNSEHLLRAFLDKPEYEGDGLQSKTYGQQAETPNQRRLTKLQGTLRSLG